MILPTRWLLLTLRRYLCTYLCLAVCCGVLLGMGIIKWTNLSSKIDCLDDIFNSTPVRVTTLPTPVLSNPKLIGGRKDSSLVSRELGNYTQMRIKWLQNRIERMSQKVIKSQSMQIDVIPTVNPNYNVHIFYYAWYESVEIDKKWEHWNHQYLPNWKVEDKKVYPTGYHQPPDDIGSNFYPLLGCYSSRDEFIIHSHMKQIKETGVGVLVVSWYPPGMSDGSLRSPDSMFERLLDIAEQYKLKLAPHIEPYKDRNPINFLTHLKYFTEKYTQHPALYKMRRGGKDLPVYYVYDSYLTPAVAWKELFSAKGNLSVRGTSQDAIFLGLLVEMQHRYDIKKAHFDGFYTYFASNGFTYGSSWKNWKSLSKYARQNGLLFIPSIGPGYIDTQVRPWNNANTRHRRHGKYYEVAWRSAIAAGASIVSITSFNEWHEGTQIEPAVSKQTAYTTYLDYEPEGPFFYLNLTRWWVNEFTKKTETLL